MSSPNATARHDIRGGYSLNFLYLDHWQPESNNPRGNFSFASNATRLNASGQPAANIYNILANAEVIPEFVQDRATAENIAKAAVTILQDPKRQQTIKADLAKIVASLGTTGASQRAAQAVVGLF